MFLDILGLSLPVFCLVWSLIGLYLLVRRKKRLAGTVVIVLSILIAGIYVYLTASTTARRAYINLDMRQLAANFGMSLSAIILGLAFVVIIYQLGKRWTTNFDFRFGLIVSVGMIAVAGGIMYWLYQSTYEAEIDDVFIQVETIEGVNVELDIPVQLFENEFIKAPTALASGPNNELFVASNEGSIWIFEDNDGDGKADVKIEFARNLAKPQGLAWGEDSLFVNEEGRLLRLRDLDGDRVSDEVTVIVDGLPRETYAFHRNHGLTFGPDGRLYIGSGATSDQSEETHPWAAGILSVNPDGSDLKFYATGLRNPYGIVPAPMGGFFAVDNGSSGCANEACDERYDVPEEVNYVVEGKDYGFPYHYGVPPQDSDTQPPIISLPEHSAPTGIMLYEGDEESRYRGQLFVSLWARNEIYRIRLYQIDETHFTGSMTLFASGIPGPSALLESPSGGIYVASYVGNAIYHIGEVKQAETATQTP